MCGVGSSVGVLSVQVLEVDVVGQKRLNQYKAKGFHIRTLTSDGEGAIKSARTLVEEIRCSIEYFRTWLAYTTC